MHRLFRLLLVIALGFGLFISACSKKEKPVVETVTEYAILKYIPADTPYAMLGLEPMSDDLIEKFHDSYEEIMQIYSKIFSNAYHGYLEKAQDANPDKPIEQNNKWIDALALEFEDGFSFEKLKQFGFSKKSVGALYGVGVLPVYRMSLEDTDLFKQAIERIEKNAGEKIPQIQIKDFTVWAIGDSYSEKDNEKGKLVLALSDGDLIVTFQPHGTSEGLLKQLIGASHPEKSLANMVAISDLMKNKGYLPQGLGFVDFRKLLKRFIDEPSGVDKEFFALLELDQKRAELSDICKTELKIIVNNVPRLVYGVTEISTESMSTESVIEVRPDLANEMTTMTSPVPGLGEAAGFFSMGFSFNIAAMREFAIKRIDSLLKAPYQCEFLKTDPATLNRAKASLNNPAAGFAEGLRGFNFVVDELDSDAVAKMMEAGKNNENKKPDFSNMQEFMSEKFSANAVVAVDNTKTLYNMAKMFSPEAAALDLKPDGKPVLLNELFPEPLPMDVFVTMSDKAFVFTAGKDSESKPAKLLNAQSNSNAPFIAYSINMKKYLNLLNTLLSNPDLADEMQKAEQGEQEMDIEDIKKLLNAVGNLFNTSVFTMGFRDDGIVFEQHLTLNTD